LVQINIAPTAKVMIKASVANPGVNHDDKEKEKKEAQKLVNDIVSPSVKDLPLPKIPSAGVTAGSES
jgi:hypothetical protein